MLQQVMFYLLFLPWNVLHVTLQKGASFLLMVDPFLERDWFAGRQTSHLITKTRRFKYIEHFTSSNWKFSEKKNSDIFYVSSQNIDCGYSLEPPQRGGSNEYLQSTFSSRNEKIMHTPVNPSFTI